MIWIFSRSFTQRSTESELMDDASISYREFSDCLIELERINHLTLAYRPTLRWLRKITAVCACPLTLLDVGSGGGDMLRQIDRHLKGRLNLTGVDLSPSAKQAATAMTPPRASIRYETADIFTFASGRQSDLIISSLFTHHLPDAELVRFISWMEQHAKIGWFINDLHRHWLPCYFIKAATWLISRNRLIRHDASVSVARAFTRQDWIAVLQQAELAPQDYKISWHFPFRYSVARVKCTHG